MSELRIVRALGSATLRKVPSICGGVSTLESEGRDWRAVSPSTPGLRSLPFVRGGKRAATEPCDMKECECEDALMVGEGGKGKSSEA